jgi:hypothetical protein
MAQEFKQNHHYFWIAKLQHARALVQPVTNPDSAFEPCLAGAEPKFGAGSKLVELLSCDFTVITWF